MKSAPGITRRSLACTQVGLRRSGSSAGTTIFIAAPPAAFALLQAARSWVLQTLGKRWTTRIIVVPGAPPVTMGPYRFLRHPNYLIVAPELPCASLTLGLSWHAAIFGLLNLSLLAWRIRCEDAAFVRAPTSG